MITRKTMQIGDNPAERIWNPLAIQSPNKSYIEPVISPAKFLHESELVESSEVEGGCPVHPEPRMFLQTILDKLDLNMTVVEEESGTYLKIKIK